MNTPVWISTFLEFLGGHELLSRLFFASVEFGALALVVGILMVLFRIRQPRLRALLWLVVLAKPLVGLAVGTPLPLLALRLAEPQPPVVQELNFEVVQGAVPLASRGLTPAVTVPTPTLAPKRVIDWSAVIPRALLGVWLAGVLAFALRLFISARRIRRIIRQAAPPSVWLSSRLAEVARGMGLAGVPPCRVTPALESPALVGFWRPVILLPEWISAEADQVRVEWSLRHELMHWRLRDPLAALVCELARMLFFFHPAAWWAGRRWQEATEMACDRALIHSLEDAAMYAEELYRMLMMIRAQRRIPVAGGLFAGRTQIRKRIESLLKNPLRTPAHLSAASLGAVILFSCASMMFGIGSGSRAAGRAAAAKTLPSPQAGLLLDAKAIKKDPAQRVQISAKTIKIDSDNTLRLEGDVRYGIDFGPFAAVLAGAAVAVNPENQGFVQLTVGKMPLNEREAQLVALGRAAHSNPLEKVWAAADKVVISFWQKECRFEGNAILVQQKKPDELWVYRSSVILLSPDAAGQPEVGITKAIRGYNGPAMTVIKSDEIIGKPAAKVTNEGKPVDKLIPGVRVIGDGFLDYDETNGIVRGESGARVEWTMGNNRLVFAGDRMTMYGKAKPAFFELGWNAGNENGERLLAKARQSRDKIDTRTIWASADRVTMASDGWRMSGTVAILMRDSDQQRTGRLMRLGDDAWIGVAPDGRLTWKMLKPSPVPGGGATRKIDDVVGEAISATQSGAAFPVRTVSESEIAEGRAGLDKVKSAQEKGAPATSGKPLALQGQPVPAGGATTSAGQAAMEANGAEQVKPSPAQERRNGGPATNAFYSVTADSNSVESVGKINYQGHVRAVLFPGPKGVVIAGDRMTLSMKSNGFEVVIERKSLPDTREQLMEMAKQGGGVTGGESMYVSADSLSYNGDKREYRFDGHVTAVGRDPKGNDPVKLLLDQRTQLWLTTNYSGDVTASLGIPGKDFDQPTVRKVALPGGSNDFEAVATWLLQAKLMIAGKGLELANDGANRQPALITIKNPATGDELKRLALQGAAKPQGTWLTANRITIEPFPRKVRLEGKVGIYPVPDNVDDHGMLDEAEIVLNPKSGELDVKVGKPNPFPQPGAAARKSDDVVGVAIPASPAGIDMPRSADEQVPVRIINQGSSGNATQKPRLKFEDLKISRKVDPATGKQVMKLTDPEGDFEITAAKVTPHPESGKYILEGSVILTQGAAISAQAEAMTLEVRDGKLAVIMDGNASITQDKNGQKTHATADTIRIEEDAKGEPKLSFSMKPGSGKAPEIKVRKRGGNAGNAGRSAQGVVGAERTRH